MIATELRCPECEDGEVTLGPACPHPSCNCAGREHGYEVGACEACGGDGRMRCVLCEEEPAVMLTADNEPACQTCGLEAEGQINIFGEAAA